METKYEWVTLASGERGIVEVQRHVVGGSIWITAPDEEDGDATRLEVRYERCATDPKRLIIVERKIREMIVHPQDGTRVGDKGDSEEDESDAGYSTDETEACYSDVSMEETAALCEAKEDELALIEEVREKTGKQGTNRLPLYTGLGRGQRNKPKALSSPEQEKCTMNAMSNTCTLYNPHGLVAKQALFQLESAGYRELLANHLETLWVVRLCVDRDDSRTRPAPSPYLDVDKLCDQLHIEPRFTRLLLCDKILSSETWLFDLPRPEDHSRIAGKYGSYSTTLNSDHLLLWRKFKTQHLEKPTMWTLYDLPPIFQCSEHDLRKKLLELRVNDGRDGGGCFFFKSINSVYGSYFSGKYTVYGVVDYRSIGSQPLTNQFRLLLDGAIVVLTCKIQCTFCGLDWSEEGSINHHNTHNCPYKKFLHCSSSRDAISGTASLPKRPAEAF